MYTQIKAIEAKALLVLRLGLDAPFLSKEEIEIIANWFSEEGLEALKENSEITVISNTETFANYATEKREGFSHSWAGDQISSTEVFQILGDVEIGKFKKIAYSQNGDTPIVEETYESPNFSTAKVQALFVNEKYEDDFNGNHEYSEKLNIVIYNPNIEQHKIAPEIQYILDNFNIKK